MPPYQVSRQRSQNPLKFQLLKKHSLVTGRERGRMRRMEGKRVAAATLYCMLIMLSGLQKQVTGFAGLCGCFSDCYHECREGHHHPGWFCTVKCVETCTIVVSGEVHDTMFAAADCSKICFTSSICGVAQIADGTADSGATTEACVDDCTENWNPYKNKHT